MQPLRLLSKVKIYFGDPPFAIWDLIASTEVRDKHKSSDFNLDHLLKRQSPSHELLWPQKRIVYCSPLPPFKYTGIIWPDKHIGNREIVFSPGSHPTISKKKKRPLSMILLLCMWEFKEQWPRCESIPSVGLIKWTCPESNYWCMTPTSKRPPRVMAVPPAYSRKKYISPHKLHPTLNCGLMSAGANEDPWEVTSFPCHVPDCCLSVDRLLSELSCTDSAAFPSVYKSFYFCTRLSWNMMPSLRLIPGSRHLQREDLCPAGVQQPKGYGLKLSIPAARPLGGWWHHATSRPWVRTSNWLIQIQPNTLLKQISVFHQESGVFLGIPHDGYLH